MPELARDFQVIAPDQRGIGLTDKPPDGYDTGTLARDLVALMEVLGHQRFALVGFDTGVAIGLVLAPAAALTPGPPCSMYSRGSVRADRLLASRGAPAGQHPARAREVAGVAVRVALQVVLVLRLGLPERTGRGDLGDDLAGPQPGGPDPWSQIAFGSGAGAPPSTHCAVVAG
jgi:pimeloyl-ACP methyl ester carboxylesterase